MKKIVSLLLFTTLLVGCSSGNDNIITSSESDISSSLTEDAIVFTSGVDNSGLSYADEKNYSNLEGKVSEPGTLYVIYDGTVLEEVDTKSDGTFAYSSKSNDTTTRLIFSNDKDLSLFDSEVATSDLINYEVIKIVPNPDYLSTIDTSSNETNTEETTTSTTNYSVGDTVSFVADDGDEMDITINSVNKFLGDEWYTPEGKFFAKVDFNIKNIGINPLEVNSQLFEFYDSEDIKSELDSNDYFSETIQSGKSANGTAYFDVMSDGSNFEVYFADTSWTGEYQ